MALKNLCSVFIVLLFSFSLFLTKAIAEPTFVQSKSINADDGEFGLTFNNDGTKMYTTLYDNTGGGQQQDGTLTNQKKSPELRNLSPTRGRQGDQPCSLC